MIEAIGVVVPAHNEQYLLPRCLDGLVRAAAAVRVGRARSGPPRVHIVVALDACSDASAVIAAENGVHTVTLAACNVGRARAAGVRKVLELERATPAERVWVCTTDADSVVPAHWLTSQLAMADAGTAAFAGTIEPDGWADHDPGVARLWNARYQRGPEHDHVHGANLGCNAAVYESVGGFSALTCDEDTTLLRALRGRSVLRLSDPAVITSTRRYGRAPGGFAAHLRGLRQDLEDLDR